MFRNVDTQFAVKFVKMHEPQRCLLGKFGPTACDQSLPGHQAVKQNKMVEPSVRAYISLSSVHTQAGNVMCVFLPTE